MKLDYKDQLNEYGDNMVRLYDFDMLEARKFSEALMQVLILQRNELDLNSLDFIEPGPCSLILRISDEDLGIYSEDDENFFCDLTLAAYINMHKLIEPFCLKETKSYRMLYDVDSHTDFLFSPSGS